MIKLLTRACPLKSLLGYEENAIQAQEGEGLSLHQLLPIHVDASCRKDHKCDISVRVVVSFLRAVKVKLPADFKFLAFTSNKLFLFCHRHSFNFPLNL